MHLYLIRHGDALSKSESGVPTDSVRPLSPLGERDVRSVAVWLARHRVPGRVALWTSPLLRARQTATVLARELGCEDRMETATVLSPEGEVERFLERLSRCTSDHVVFTVGHQPLLGRLASALAFGGVIDGLSLAPGGVAWLELADFPQSLEGLLHGLWRPEHLSG